MRKLVQLFLVILSVFMLGSCSDTENTNLTKIQVGFHTNYGGSGAVITGIEKGYFTEQGLEVEMVPFSAGPPAVAALNAGNVDFAYVGQGAHSLIINGHAQIVLTQNISDAEAIITRKSYGIDSVADLAGKTVAVMLGTSSEEILKVALMKNGIDESDVTLVNYDMAGAVSALEIGRVDAICVWEHYRYDAEMKLGEDALLLATTNDFAEDYVSLSSWVATEEYIEENESTVNKFVRALLKSQNYWEQNTEEVCRLVSEELNIPLTDLLKGQYLNDYFSVKELAGYLESGELVEMYSIQKNYFAQSNESIADIEVTDYLITKYMESAVDYLS